MVFWMYKGLGGVDVNLKCYLSSQQRHKLTETKLCKK